MCFTRANFFFFLSSLLCGSCDAFVVAFVAMPSPMRMCVVVHGGDSSSGIACVHSDALPASK
jgi:hypothetical protein